MAKSVLKERGAQVPLFPLYPSGRPENFWAAMYFNTSNEWKVDVSDMPVPLDLKDNTGESINMFDTLFNNEDGGLAWYDNPNTLQM